VLDDDVLVGSGFGTVLDFSGANVTSFPDGACVVLRNSAVLASVAVIAPPDLIGILVDGGDGARVAGVKVTGGVPSLKADNSSGFTISDCEFVDSVGTGRGVDIEDCADFRIGNVEVTGYLYQISAVTCSRFAIRGVWLSGSIGTAIGSGYGVFVAWSSDLTIADVFSVQSSTAGRHHVYLSTVITRARVHDCHLISGTQAQIAVYCKTQQGTAQHIHIEHNFLRDMDSDVTATGAIVATESIEHLWINRNTITNPRPVGIRIQAGVVGARLTENHILGADVAAISTEPQVYQRDNVTG